MPKLLAPLSARAVASLTESAFVGGVPGLQLVVSPKGVRAWRVFYRVAGGDGRRRALSLGRYPEVSLADARRRAAEALRAASDGRDPKREREEKVRREELTFGALMERYLADCASRNAASTVRDKRCLLTLHAASRLGDLSAARLTRADVLAAIDALAQRPVTRRKVYAYLRHLFEWAEERELVSENPLLRVKAPKTAPPRERVLSDEEIAALWRAEGTMADIARLLLLTAQRKGSVEAMRWDEIDVANAIWRIPPPSMKSGRAHAVPFSEAALEIVLQRPRLAGPYVFGVGSDGAKPFAGASNGFSSLRRQVGFEDWRPHDLRRTAVTLAQRGGAPIEEIRALTQHKTPGVIGVYARHAYEDEKRRVVEIISSFVASKSVA